MPRLTIDGQEVNVEPGTTVIQAAEKLGVYIPRYCYHPGLSIAGSCRMCLVDAENSPKLQIACYTPAVEGMKIITNNEKVKQARRHMLEFLLTNHPLDCPVCDQSGECDLQNFYMEYGRYESRFLEDKIKKKKATPLGPHVVLDQERCILCSRCTRFTEEISRSHELGIFNRGNRSLVDLHPGKTLDNPYSGNVIDICPVGALTEREFRFKCRVWYLASQPSVCTGCSRGCNVWIHFNASQRSYKNQGRRIQRLKPRFNPHVNQWWMCDEGRFGFEFIDQNRIEFPHLRQGSRLQPVDWEEALQTVVRATRSALDKFGPESVGVIASAMQSNEELYLVKKLFGDGLGVSNIGHRNPAEREGFSDDFLVRGDKNPNRAGAEALDLTASVDSILEKATHGDIKVLWVFHHELPPQALEGAQYVVFMGSNWNRTTESAQAVLAGVTHAEKDGTFSNFEGRIQHFQQAVPPLEESRNDVGVLLDLARRLDCPLDLQDAGDVFRQWCGKSLRELEPFGELLTAAAV